jgi:glutamate dehydrogenase/leucine dehydrogenase
MSDLLGKVNAFEMALKEKVDLRTAAYRVAVSRVAEAGTLMGVYP